MFEITEQTRAAIQGWLHQLGGRQRGPLFPSRVNPKRGISTRQYARLVDSWVASIGLDPSTYGTHSLATLIYRRTGNIRAVRDTGHHNITMNTISICCSELDELKTPRRGDLRNAEAIKEAHALVDGLSAQFNSLKAHPREPWPAIDRARHTAWRDVAS
jgi:hypothetical protein